jgi:hypothetical protein
MCISSVDGNRVLALAASCEGFPAPWRFVLRVCPNQGGVSVEYFAAMIPLFYFDMAPATSKNVYLPYLQ